MSHSKLHNLRSLYDVVKHTKKQNPQQHQYDPLLLYDEVKCKPRDESWTAVSLQTWLHTHTNSACVGMEHNDSYCKINRPLHQLLLYDRDVFLETSFVQRKCVKIKIRIPLIFFLTGLYSPYARWPSLMDFSIHRNLVGLLCW
jgi:hypothetical protein